MGKQDGPAAAAVLFRIRLPALEAWPYHCQLWASLSLGFFLSQTGNCITCLVEFT